MNAANYVCLSTVQSPDSAMIKIVQHVKQLEQNRGKVGANLMSPGVQKHPSMDASTLENYFNDRVSKLGTAESKEPEEF